jgi:hypothetical protein
MILVYQGIISQEVKNYVRNECKIVVGESFVKEMNHRSSLSINLVVKSAAK